MIQRFTKVRDCILSIQKHLLLQLLYAGLTFFGVKMVKHHANCTSTFHNESELHNDLSNILLKLLIK